MIRMRGNTRLSFDECTSRAPLRPHCWQMNSGQLPSPAGPAPLRARGNSAPPAPRTPYGHRGLAVPRVRPLRGERTERPGAMPTRRATCASSIDSGHDLPALCAIACFGARFPVFARQAAYGAVAQTAKPGTSLPGHATRGRFTSLRMRKPNNHRCLLKKVMGCRFCLNSPDGGPLPLLRGCTGRAIPHAIRWSGT